MTVAGVGDVTMCQVCFGVFDATQEFRRWFCCCLPRWCASHFLHLIHLWPALATICAISPLAVLAALLVRILLSIC